MGTKLPLEHTFGKEDSSKKKELFDIGLKKLAQMEATKPKKPKNFNQASNTSLIMLPHTRV